MVREKLRCPKCGSKESWSVRRGPTKPVFNCSTCGNEWTCGLSGGEWMLPRLKAEYDALPPYGEPDGCDVMKLFTDHMGRRAKKKFEKKWRNPALTTDTSRLFGSPKEKP